MAATPSAPAPPPAIVEIVPAVGVRSTFRLSCAAPAPTRGTLKVSARLVEATRNAPLLPPAEVGRKRTPTLHVALGARPRPSMGRGQSLLTMVKGLSA